MLDELLDELPTVDDQPAATLSRTPPHYTQRRVAFVDVASGTLVREGRGAQMHQQTLDTPLSAAHLLATLAALDTADRPRMVFLVGGDSAASTPEPQWWLAPAGQGWRLSQWHNAADRRTAVYERDHVTLDLRMAAPWFGAEGAALDPLTCLGAWRMLLRQVRGSFGAGAALLTTPALTGMQTFAAALPYGVRLPTLPASQREHLQSITTQGRIELFPPRSRSIVSLCELDARWMYAACLHNLPVGPVLRDARREYAGFTPGFYLAEVRVPSDWPHIGLLPDLATLDAPTPLEYPRTPRTRFWTWASGAEIGLALDYGWRVDIHQRILWPETGNAGHPDVAKSWIRDLRAMRATVQTGALAGRPESPLVANAIRHLALDTVGRWYSRDRTEYGVCSDLADMPRGAIPHLEGGLVHWERSVPLSAKQLPYAHPEWAATVWGRARARLARQALTLPLASIVALRTDGIWTTARPGAIMAYSLEPDNGQPGAWRIKAQLDEASYWPRDESELRELMRRARGRAEVA